jgi:hypothetical protein
MESAVFGGATNATIPTMTAMLTTPPKHHSSNRGMRENSKRDRSFSLVLTVQQMAADNKKRPIQNVTTQPKVIRWKTLRTSVLAVIASPQVTAADRNDIRQRVRGPGSLESAAYVTRKSAKQITGRIINMRYLVLDPDCVWMSRDPSDTWPVPFVFEQSYEWIVLQSPCCSTGGRGLSGRSSRFQIVNVCHPGTTGIRPPTWIERVECRASRSEQSSPSTWTGHPCGKGKFTLRTTKHCSQLSYGSRSGRQCPSSLLPRRIDASAAREVLHGKI